MLVYLLHRALLFAMLSGHDIMVILATSFESIVVAIDIAMIVIGIAKCPGRKFIGTRVRQHQL